MQNDRLSCIFRDFLWVGNMWKSIWSKIREYMDIEPDPEVAKAENQKTVRLILLAGLLNSIFLIVLEKVFLGNPRNEMIIGCGFFVFFLAFTFVNWTSLKEHITVEMELMILAMLILIAFVDYFPGVRTSAFLFLIMLALLPPLVFDKPWKLLLIVLVAGILAFFFNLHVADEAIRTRNLIRILSVTFLSSVFSCHYSHSRCRSVQIRKSTQIVADHDPLTGIYNRGGGSALIRSCVEQHESGTFMIIDIDDFKIVNDCYGHQKGDDILKEVAKTLQASFKQTDIVMRMGGDEFIVYALGMVDYAVSCKRLEQLGEAIRAIMISKKDGRFVTVSVGGAINDGSYPDYESLYKAADQYLYKTKAKGKDGYSLLGTSYKAG